MENWAIMEHHWDFNPGERTGDTSTESRLEAQLRLLRAELLRAEEEYPETFRDELVLYERIQEFTQTAMCSGPDSFAIRPD